LFKEL